MLSKKIRICVGYLLRNARTAVAERLGGIQNQAGSSHRALTLAESLAYIDRVFDDYLRYSGRSTADLDGARILEVGPGDNYGVALRFLAAGAAEAVCLDRFETVADSSQHKRIYEELRARLPPDEAGRYAAIARPDDPARPSALLEPVLGVSIERATEALPGRRFDWIVSRAVLEEVHDIEASLRSMDRLLAPGGLLLHKVDCRDYGIFRHHGFHPLEIYTIPDWIYRPMSRSEPIPKRRFPRHYLQILEGLGYQTTVYYSHLAGREEELEPHWSELPDDAEPVRQAKASVERIRPRLARRFRNLPAEELIVGGFFFAARKPGARRDSDASAR